ncbi:MAG TPA: hypothetical protein VGK23_01535 [Methanomassiliicoccales archaeon]
MRLRDRRRASSTSSFRSLPSILSCCEFSAHRSNAWERHNWPYTREWHDWSNAWERHDWPYTREWHDWSNAWERHNWSNAR